jgi:phage shock protein C
MTSEKKDIRRLYKSRTERMIDGVCGGLSEYLSIDPTLVRIAFVLLLFYGGLGLVLYLVGLILMPTAPRDYVVREVPRSKPSQRSNTLFWGILLVTVGALWLMNNMGLAVWHRWWGFSWGVVLAVLLILAGVAFLFGGRSYVSSQEVGPERRSAKRRRQPAEPRTVERLFRSRSDRKILGVCGGLGDYFVIDPTVLRLAFVLAVLASGGMMVVPYLVMAIVVPLQPEPAPSS